jgi:hypothetical protein
VISFVGAGSDQSALALGLAAPPGEAQAAVIADETIAAHRLTKPAPLIP